mgnify:CR=1 FL=1
MKAAVVGAHTVLGSGVVTALERRGIHSVAIMPKLCALAGEGQIIIKDYAELTAEDLFDVQVVIDAVSFPNITAFSSDMLPLWHELELLNMCQSKLLCIGSASCLFADDSRSTSVFDSSCLCQEDEGFANRLRANAFKRLQAEQEVFWTLLCPPLICDEHSPRTGNYEFSGDVLPMGEDGSSCISIADLADAAAELLKCGLQMHKVVSVRAL